MTAGSLTIELASAELARLDTHDMLICSGTDPRGFRYGPERPLIPITELRDEISGDPRPAPSLCRQLMGGWLEAVSDRHISQALRLIHDWPGYAWTDSELSRRCGLERSAFIDQFQALTHKTPLQYLRLWRMDLGAHALADSLECAPVDVPSLASELGFASMEMFCDIFATHFGVDAERWPAFEAADRLTPPFVGFTRR